MIEPILFTPMTLFVLLLAVIVPAWAILGWRRDRIRGPIRVAHDRCLNCQYHLAGLPTHGTCPECGHPYDSSKARSCPAPSGGQWL